MREIDQYAEEMRILNLRVCRGGEILLKRDWNGEICRNQYSASKSFTSVAVGIACREGLLSLDEKLCDVFAKDIPPVLWIKREKKKGMVDK